MRDHGGNLDQAKATYGEGAWIDLSTGINRRPWPIPDLPEGVWRDLPTKTAQNDLIRQAAQSWNVAKEGEGIALCGAQAAIQLVPRLLKTGRAAVLGPTYNEHAACLEGEGWEVRHCSTLEEMHGADLAIVVNPNNPDGRHFCPENLLELAQKVGFLVVDESFGDVTPELSLLPHAGRAELLILRSFGKFYGLAGVRLGFAFGAGADIAALTRMSGPWPVSGPALEIGKRALADVQWANAMRLQLAKDSARADGVVGRLGWSLVGGCSLFRLYDVGDALAAQERLARHHIWSRIFPWSNRYLRLGLPGAETEWTRLEEALWGERPPR